MTHNFPPLKNTSILQAAWGRKPDRLPIWIMRQAGRYLPEFREFRQKHDFFEICQTPELACEVTLQPIRRFDLDASIIFSDILVIPQALGMEVQMKPGVGPFFPNPLESEEDVDNLNTVNAVDRLKYVGEAITLTRHKLEGKVPLIGFSATPWTLMCYMVEGGGSKTCSKAKKWLYQNTEWAIKLLQLLTEVIIDYLVMQVEYGAQLLQVFDSNAEYLDNKTYVAFSIPYIREIRREVLAKLREKNLEAVPMIIFAKGAHHSLKDLADCDYEVMSLDWTVKPQEARKIVGKDITLQGNLDPCALYGSEAKRTFLMNDMIEEFGTSRYIVNLGHGIYPDMDPEAVKHFIEVAHSYQV